jgi:predicted helicase
MPSHREALRGIRTFPQLIAFLRDEMDWPIETDDFEELTFDYTPEELGIDMAVAAKIEKNGIKRLRPLAANQPWGIFFVKFEPKRLPVVALRRVLSRVVLKKRASANNADRAAWQADDLLFISNYGEGDDRQISFAHFSTHADKADLPTLMVLGWDSDNTALHLDEVADKLTTELAWPQHTEDVTHWREKWRAAFTLRHREVITTSKALAERLANLARSIRQRVNAVLRIESEKGPLRRLHAAFRNALIHDLTADDFADMYAQTIAYGLLTARVSRPSGLVAQNLSDMVPVTNPFLKDLLDSFLSVGGRKGKVDFDELGISEIVELLRDANMEAVLRDFGDRNPEEDPAIHFYQYFLQEYDSEKRMQRGVFYTPRPVVSYIVRSVHELLQMDFGLEEGLASTVTWSEMANRQKHFSIPAGVAPNSPFVQILDPATGTATFLVEVIDVIHRTLTAKWQGQRLTESQQRAAWNDYVPKHLLTRLHGYELMMAPYAIAHMKIGLKLYETGYRFGSNERVRIYLTNALEPASDDKKQREFAEWAPALAHEAQAVNAVKRHQRFTVVIGNPPYSKSSQNQGAWIEGLMEEYKRTVRTAETQIQALSDDYSKFLRLGQFTLEQCQVGILSFISNNGYLDGPLFRDMRSSMLAFFGGIRILNLHGDSRKQFSPPEGKGDENVFDIQQGVATSVFWKKRSLSATVNIAYAELWGSRQERYDALNNSSAIHETFEQLYPTEPFFLFIPMSKELEAEFCTGWHLYDVFGTGNKEVDNHESYGAGFVTQQDKFAVGFSEGDIAENVREFLDPKASDEALWEKFEFCSTNQWSFSRAKKELMGLDILRLTKCCLYRPFDYRFTVFDRNICTIIRKRITSQFDKNNVGLLTTRRVTRLPYNNVFVTKCYAEYKVASHDRNTIVFPLWIQTGDEGNKHHLFGNKRRLNLNREFLRAIAGQLKLPLHHEQNLPHGLGPEQIFDYAYAVLHSLGYRSRYAEFLKIDFPRLPLTGDLDLFRTLAQFGGELVALHLMESPKIDKPLTTYAGTANPEVEKVSYARDTVWLDKAQKCGFKGVPETVWSFHIGGYQVCEKWLKDRKGRALSKDDIAHYHKIVVALSETIHLMAEIDKAIEAHGGWPGAFAVARD